MHTRHTAALALILVSCTGIAVFAARAHGTRYQDAVSLAATAVASTAEPTRAAVAASREAPSVPVRDAAVREPAPAPRARELPVPAEEPAPAALATMTVIGSSTAVYPLTGADGTSLADAMEALATQQTGFSFSAREFSGMGAFVESIEGRPNEDGFYWILSINGTKSARGVSSVILHQGDSVEWRYERGY